MAYNKKTWKARQGLGLNKFSIDGATPVPIINQPDSVTQQGDALSAGNLNDLEQRIEDGFDDADASIANVQGNLETYETTNDMRVATNSQNIQNIQNALSGAVIQEHVDSTQKNVKTILSADELLPWAILKRVGARSTQFNQIIGDSYIQIPVGTYNFYDISTHITMLAGHIYFLSCDNSELGVRIRNYDSGYAGQIGQTIIVSDITTTDARYVVQCNGTSTKVSNLNLYDLTAMNEYDSGKTDAQNIASFREKYPATNYPFNAGDIYDVPPLSFLIRGTNQWDEKWEVGEINDTTGAKKSSSTRIRSKNYIPVTPNTSYYFKVTVGIIVFGYDANKNTVKLGDNTMYIVGVNNAITTPSNVSYLMFYTGSDSYGTTYKHDIMICLSSVTDKTYKPFIGQTIDTSFMAGKKYVNSSCYDYAENVYVDGVLKRKDTDVVEQIDLGDLAWSIINDNVLFSGSAPSGIKIVANSTIVSDWLLSKYINDSPTRVYSKTMDKTIAVQQNSGCIFIYDTSITSADIDGNGHVTKLENVLLNYELAQKVVSYGDPIPNFPCEDGSTIMANTPQTEIVNAIDVPSTIGYSTKIA